jgi:hypothetical protein
MIIATFGLPMQPIMIMEGVDDNSDPHESQLQYAIVKALKTIDWKNAF